MKKKFLFLFIILTIAFLSGCLKKKKEINFIENGGSEVDDLSFKDVSKIVIPVTTKEGFVFAGWYLDEELTEIFDESDIKLQNYTIYAKWITNAEKLLLDATNAVLKAEYSETRSDLDNAIEIVNTLPNNEEKGELYIRLDNVRIKVQLNELTEEITDTILKANLSKISEDIDFAELTIEEKTALILQLVESINEQNLKIEEARNMVLQAEQTKTEEDLNLAKTLVEALPYCKDKSELLARIELIEIVITKRIEAASSVGDAETTCEQRDLDKAKNLVSNLEDGDFKNELQSRVDAVQVDINLRNEIINLVSQVESSFDQTIINQINDEMSNLSESTKKEQIQTRINFVQAEIYVREAEIDQLQESVNKATDVINLLPDGDIKTNLQNRINIIQVGINSDVIIVDAVDSVRNVEASKLQADFEIAQSLVNQLADGEAKKLLQTRLNKITIVG